MVPDILEIGGHEFVLHVSDVLLMVVIFAGGAAMGGLFWFLRNAPPQATDEPALVQRVAQVTPAAQPGRDSAPGVTPGD